MAYNWNVKKGGSSGPGVVYHIINTYTFEGTKFYTCKYTSKKLKHFMFNYETPINESLILMLSNALNDMINSGLSKIRVKLVCLDDHMTAWYNTLIYDNSGVTNNKHLVYDITSKIRILLDRGVLIRMQTSKPSTIKSVDMVWGHINLMRSRGITIILNKDPNTLGDLHSMMNNAGTIDEEVVEWGRNQGV